MRGGVAPLLETQMDNRIGTLEDRLETRISLLESKVDGSHSTLVLTRRGRRGRE